MKIIYVFILLVFCFVNDLNSCREILKNVQVCGGEVIYGELDDLFLVMCVNNNKIASEDREIAFSIPKNFVFLNLYLEKFESDTIFVDYCSDLEVDQVSYIYSVISAEITFKSLNYEKREYCAEIRNALFVCEEDTIDIKKICIPKFVVEPFVSADL